MSYNSIHTLFVVCPSHTISLPSWDADTRFLQMPSEQYLCNVIHHKAIVQTYNTKYRTNSNSQRIKNKCNWQIYKILAQFQKLVILTTAIGDLKKDQS